MRPMANEIESAKSFVPCSSSERVKTNASTEMVAGFQVRMHSGGRHNNSHVERTRKEGISCYFQELEQQLKQCISPTEVRNLDEAGTDPHSEMIKSVSFAAARLYLVRGRILDPSRLP
jgi:hypothetical protein